MEVSVIGKSQGKIQMTELPCRYLGFFGIKDDSRIFSTKTKICFRKRPRLEQARVRFALNEIQKDSVRSENVRLSRKLKSQNGVRLYVGLPLDAVSTCNAIRHGRAIAAGLKALKLLGVEGVELPVWWGIAEREAMGKFDWVEYLSLAKMVESAGLKLHVSLCFHASKQPKIPLPEWVLQIGASDPGIYFTDQSGKLYEDCLSLGVDDRPVLMGETPIQVYSNFCESFKSSFSSFMGSTISGISMGLGPDGFLQYPSQRQLRLNGVGEFQCYDKNMLSLLAEHAKAMGNPLWGLGGPHDAPKYNETPNSNNFFKDHGGSWESQYGDFFLSWYSNQLIAHSDRLLSVASSIFSDTRVTVHGKIPLIHSWYKTRSHPGEVTAGIYNTVNRDGYDQIAKIFAKNSCKMILSGVDLSDKNQMQESISNLELLLTQINSVCKDHGVAVVGQNSSESGAPNAFEQIKKNMNNNENGMDLFIYQRMGAYFFSPEHFPAFTEFVRSINQPEMHSDDLPLEEDEDMESACITRAESGLCMQAV